MLSTFKLLWSLFDEHQKRKIKELQLLILFLSLFEIITVISVALFMHMISNIDSVKKLSLIHKIYLDLGSSNANILFLCAILLVVVLSVSAFFSVYGVKKINKISLAIGREVAVKLFRFYQNKDWLYHTQVNSSWIINRILVETQRLTLNVLTPFLLLLSRLTLVFFLTISLIIYNPFITIGGAALFIGGYLVIFKFVKPRLSRNSRSISIANQQRLRNLNEGFEGIKNVILLNKEKHFTEEFEKSATQVMNAQASNMTISATPKYVMEWMAYVSMACLVIYFVVIQQKEINQIIPIITLYGVAAFKILPSLQQIYSHIANIRGNYSVVNELAKDIVSSSQIKNPSHFQQVFFEKAIQIERINFSYPGQDKCTIKDLTIEIKKNQCVGFVGPSGSGKSTLIDILSGLIEINSGCFLVDGVDIKNNLTGWRENISYVPQTISLTDSSIAENIAFGVRKEDINIDQVKRVIKLSHLDELITQLDNGINTIIGERGVQLSGGQRQRIGIARALYRETNILIFDEATSALDGITEKLIMDAIHELNGDKTIIIIAHRLKTVQLCDQIFFINNGQLVDQGSYLELLKNNLEFRNMSIYS